MIEKLKGKIPEAILAELEQYKKKGIIKTPIELAHFLAQCAHESGGFRLFVENLNYSEQALLKVFPKYFKDKELAKKYARKPEQIANRVYANRMGNGDENSGDGWKYRGRGAIQLTGKNNYEAFYRWLNKSLSDTNLVATKYPVTSAVWFFQKNGLFDLCKDDSEKTITTITKRVNGGANGLKDRIKYFDLYYSLLKIEDKKD